jgi:Brp/Blh family beta-carotene 15,15'-monooxygenase
VKDQELRVFTLTRTISSSIVAVVIILSLIFSAWLGSSDISWQIVLALVALAAGIPHGALDHLVTLPKSAPAKMALFVTIYVAIAGLAIVAILMWNVAGFIVVVAMSSLHFGIGDAAFISEMDKRRLSSQTFPRYLYALAAGIVPVVIPLVNDQSTDALAQVNGALINWHQGFASQLEVAVLGLAVAAAISLVAYRRFRELIDLALLVSLAFLAPPLVAFATYFGCWHAMRHTARLTLVLGRSQKNFQLQKPGKAFLSAVIPGLPALVGTFVVAAAIALVRNEPLSTQFFWMALVVVWALTVPHMLVTAKLDRAALTRT